MEVETSKNDQSQFRARAAITLLTPPVLSIKNRWSSRYGLPRKELFSALLTVMMTVGLYACCTTMLRELSQPLSHFHLTYSPIIAALLAAMFIMTLLSASVSAMSALYASKDIDFLLASPVSEEALVLTKVAEITLSLFWMLFVFGIPLYLSFGEALSADVLYYVISPILVFAFLAPAVLFGTTAAILFSSLLPARGGRHAFALLFAVSIGLFFAIINNGAKLLLPSATQSSSVLALLSSGSPWYLLATSSIARSIETLAQGNLAPTTWAIGACAGITTLAWVITVVFFKKLFRRTHTKLQVSSSPLQLDSRLGRSVARVLFAMTRRGTRALITKEIFAFSRELTQTLQLVMLLTICALYSYNFSHISPPTRVGVEILQLWDVLMTALNVLLGLMVILSISSRFVFPSVSLEGNSLWVIQSAPISPRDILRAKYTSWFSLIVIVSLAIFSAGGCAMGVEPRVIIASAVSGIIISHGIVTLGLGFGARFARFDWEHAGQLATNTGNLAYMATGVLLLAINMVPVTLMFGAYYLLPSVFRDDMAALMLLASGVTVLSIINITVGRVSISIGARALQRCLL